MLLSETLRNRSCMDDLSSEIDETIDCLGWFFHLLGHVLGNHRRGHALQCVVDSRQIQQAIHLTSLCGIQSVLVTIVTYGVKLHLLYPELPPSRGHGQFPCCALIQQGTDPFWHVLWRDLPGDLLSKLNGKLFHIVLPNSVGEHDRGGEQSTLPGCRLALSVLYVAQYAVNDLK